VRFLHYYVSENKYDERVQLLNWCIRSSQAFPPATAGGEHCLKRKLDEKLDDVSETERVIEVEKMVRLESKSTVETLLFEYDIQLDDFSFVGLSSPQRTSKTRKTLQSADCFKGVARPKSTPSGAISGASAEIVITNNTAEEGELLKANVKMEKEWDKFCSVCRGETGPFIKCQTSTCTRVFHYCHHVPPVEPHDQHLVRYTYCVIFLSDRSRTKSKETIGCCFKL